MSHARRGLPVRLGDYQANVGESLPARQLIFSVSSHHHSNPAERYSRPFKQPQLSVHHRRGSTIRPTSINLRSEVVRASRLDNLTFSSYVSEANPSNRWARPPVGRRLSIPTILYLSVFTCPTQWASISRRSPARASRPDNLAFSSPTLATLIRPTQWVCAPVGRRREPHS